jgi:hypothetical protein
MTVSALKKIFVSLGAMCGLYGCVELVRVIKYYIDHVSFLYLFGFEYAILIIAIAWIVISAVDDLFLKSDYLGGD